MSSIINRLARFIPFTGGRRMMGKDLEGNKYYEMPNPAGGRMKRVVKYKVIAHISEYTNGSRQRIPVQWTAWLSHTRPDPPSIEELTKDAQRLSRLQPMIAAIEEREREERIRQGYLKEGAPKQVHAALADRSFQPAPVLSLPTPRSHSGSRSPSDNQPGAPAASESSVERNQHPASSTVSQSPQLQFNPWPTASAATNPNMPLTSSSKRTTGQEYRVPTPTSPSVPPQAPTVDPMKHASKEELRKLSEEDTKRRIAEGGLDPHPVNDPVLTGGGNPEPVPSTPLQPRRRGGK